MKESNIFNKIKSFFKNIFNNQKKLPEASNFVPKKEFLDMYDKLKKGELDILSIDPDISERMCTLLEEEIKLKENLLNSKLLQIDQLDEDIKKLKTAI